MQKKALRGLAKAIMCILVEFSKKANIGYQVGSCHGVPGDHKEAIAELGCHFWIILPEKKLKFYIVQFFLCGAFHFYAAATSLTEK